MGVKSRKRKPREEEAGFVPQPPDASRDADALPVDGWPIRPFPANVPGRAAGFQVVFAEDVIDDIREHGRSSPQVEVCGVLVGSVYHDDTGPWCHVVANIRGNGAEGRNAQVTFTSDTWAHINTTMDSQYPDERIVGWYHTHPGFGIFLSEMDVFIHQNFFGEPWQIAYVDDPKGGDRGVFVWEKGLAVRRPHLLEPYSDSPMAGLTAAARARNARRIGLARRRKRIRRAIFALILIGLLVGAALVYKGIIPRQRITNLIPAGWVSDKFVGPSTPAAPR
jgi:proteasome lid subunit RPN8/RPN11